MVDTLLSHYGIQRSISELASIFSCQWSNGMLPQIRFAPLPDDTRPYRPDAQDWGVTGAISGKKALPTSGITQPPIIGLCELDVFQRLDTSVRLEYLAEFGKMAVALQRYHAWLSRERDPHHENLVACIHPWETGMDNSPAMLPMLDAVCSYLDNSTTRAVKMHFQRADTTFVNAQHRPTVRDYKVYIGLLNLFRNYQYNCHDIVEATPFLYQDVLFNSLFCISIQSLAALQENLADLAPSREEKSGLRDAAGRNREQAGEVAAAIRSKLWDTESGYFYGYDLKGNRLLTIPTVASFMPLLGGIASTEQEESLIAHLLDPAGFGAYLSIPSTLPTHPLFDPVRYWSGPVWPVTNWLVWRGLRERNHAVALSIRSSTLNMIAEGVPFDEVARLAKSVMEANSAAEEYTTPSTRQYRHAWLWDSAITAVSWPYVEEKPAPHQLDGGKPGFWEYYHPSTGAPLGAPYMTWTASLFLYLLYNS